MIHCKTTLWLPILPYASFELLPQSIMSSSTINAFVYSEGIMERQYSPLLSKLGRQTGAANGAFSTVLTKLWQSNERLGPVPEPQVPYPVPHTPAPCKNSKVVYESRAIEQARLGRTTAHPPPAAPPTPSTTFLTDPTHPRVFHVGAYNGTGTKNAFS